VKSLRGAQELVEWGLAWSLPAGDGLRRIGTLGLMPVAIVTGGNQGLGLALVRLLCRRLGEDGVVYLGARDPQRGAAAVDLLRNEGLAPRLHVVDVRDTSAVQAFAATLREEHGGVDIVLSNAAARRTPDRPESEQIRTFVDTNNLGARRMIDAFGPMLNDGSRFIVVASAFGSLYFLPQPMHERFDTTTMTLDDVDAVMDEFAALVEAGSHEHAGWPADVNVVSKVGQVASMRVMARDLQPEARRRGILVNAACPGMVDTEASRPWFSATALAAAKSPDDAATDVGWLATLPAGTTKPYGELVQYRDVLPWDADEWGRKFG
jgi:carbonyl reductase 1